jgi:hypothetical protein
MWRSKTTDARETPTPVARAGARKFHVRQQRKNVFKPHRGRYRPESGTRGLAAENVRAAGARNCTSMLRVAERGGSHPRRLARVVAGVNGIIRANFTADTG